MENTQITPNIIEVDLNKNLVIQIPEGYKKADLIKLLSIYYNYADGEQKIVRKTFMGTFEDFQTANAGKVLAVISVENGVVTYDIQENVPHEENEDTYCIKKYLKPSNDNLLNILKEINLKAFNEKQAREKEKMEVAVAKGLEGLKSSNVQ